MNDFAYIPNEGPPRLIRFAPQSMYAGPWVAVLNKGTNVLIINEEAYDLLSKEEQTRLFKTQDAYTYFE